MIGGGSETIKNISCSPSLVHCILIQPATITLGHGGSVLSGGVEQRLYNYKEVASNYIPYLGQLH